MTRRGLVKLRAGGSVHCWVRWDVPASGPSRCIGRTECGRGVWSRMGLEFLRQGMVTCKGCLRELERERAGE